MTFVPVMFSVWGALLLFFIAIKLYAARLARDEDDQIVLNDSSSRMRTEQADIVARVGKIEPVKRVALGLVIAMTLFVIGYYILDIVHQFS
jgi:hypothetical protein